ncbi:hypothetical protein VTO42DRAFT_7782 [Malbranchea cinnamomea]
MKLHALIDRLSVPTSKSTVANVWINDDIRPLPPARRTWTQWAFISFWAINQIALGNWQVGASLIAVGLSVWQTVIAVIIAKAIIAIVAVFNGYVGAQWHIGFPVFSRMIWGMYGSYLAILQRILLSVVWFAVQSWTGGLCVTAVLASIFSGFHHLENRFPESAHMTTKQFIGWVVYNVLTIPMLWLPPERTKRMFYIMNTLSFFTLIGIMIWALSHAGGAGPLVSQPAKTSSGEELGWAIVSGITTVIGSIAVGLANVTDYSRFARKPGDQVFGQWSSILFLGALMPTFGCLASSAIMDIYGEAIWNPPDIALKWLEVDYSATSRAGAFFVGVGLVVCQLAVNTIDNAFSAGMDLAGLFPKFINIRRGGYIAFVISIALCPWELLASASTFINVLSAYSVFLGPMCGIMVAEYWVIRRRKIKLSDLYDPHREGIYYFWYGINPRAFIAWVVGFAPLLPGFISTVNPSISVPIGAVRFYYLAYPAGFAVSFVLYIALNKIFPPRGLGEFDAVDHFDTFTPGEAEKLGVIPSNAAETVGVPTQLKDAEST